MRGEMIWCDRGHGAALALCAIGSQSITRGHAMTQDCTTQVEPMELFGRAKREEPTELAEQQLAEVAGGFLAFTFKLVAVKTISWAHD
jgi:hypothetical protein